ncbi:hypothetical protein CEXT_661041 [Caerostris extrusa]|uniref:Uncharacterized protein n=1 Tax=Caerostris extrusa TaxID=172846 RepID=A0AAV4NJE9_CAEEX|nr:hypothetical protein CEXT_661041 [Caerostris extrusa]
MRRGNPSPNVISFHDLFLAMRTTKPLCTKGIDLFDCPLKALVGCFNGLFMLLISRFGGGLHQTVCSVLNSIQCRLVRVRVHEHDNFK